MRPSTILFLSAVFVGMASVAPVGVAMSTHRMHRRAVTDGEPSASSSPSDPGKAVSNTVPSFSGVLEMVKQGDEYAIQLFKPAVAVYNPSKPLPPSSLLFAKDMKEKQPTARIMVKQVHYDKGMEYSFIASLNLADKEPIRGQLDCTFEEQQLSPDWMKKLYATDEHLPSIRLAFSLTFHLNIRNETRQCYYTELTGDTTTVWDERYNTAGKIQLGLEAIGKVVGWMAELDQHNKDMTVSPAMIFEMYFADKAGQPIPSSTNPDQLDQSLGGVYIPLILDHNTGTRNNRVPRSTAKFFNRAFNWAMDYMREGHKIGSIGTSPEDPKIQQQIKTIRALKGVQKKANAFIQWIRQISYLK